MEHIKFEYFYRDEDNYKTFGHLILSNPKKLPLVEVNGLLVGKLIEGTWFDPDLWSIPRFNFHLLSPFGINDYLWYEFEAVSITAQQNGRFLSVNEFLSSLEMGVI